MPHRCVLSESSLWQRGHWYHEHSLRSAASCDNWVSNRHQTPPPPRNGLGPERYKIRGSNDRYGLPARAPHHPSSLEPSSLHDGDDVGLCRPRFLTPVDVLWRGTQQLSTSEFASGVDAGVSDRAVCAARYADGMRSRVGAHDERARCRRRAHVLWSVLPRSPRQKRRNTLNFARQDRACDWSET